MNPFRRVREANRLTLRVAGPALLYGLGVGLLSTLVLAPLLLWLLAGALAVTAGGTVLNWDLTDFTLSLPAVAMLALGAIAVSVLTVVGFGGHVLITAAGAEGRRVSLPRVLGEVGVALTRIRGMGVLKVAALVVLLLPTVAAVAGLLAGLLLAPFQREETLRLGLRALPPAWMLVLAGAAFFVGATCYVRWSFAMHAVMLEGTTLGRGIRRSVEMVRGRFWSLAALHAVHQVGLAILLGVVALLLGLAGRLALAVIPFGDAAASRWGLALLLVIDTVILAVATTLGVVRGIAVLTQAWLDHGGGRARLDRSRADVPSQASTSVVWRRRPWATVGLVLVATGGMTVFALPGVGKELEAMDRPVKVTAHRGSSAEAPENTLAALRLAIVDGADFAEIDIQQAKDGTLVLLHDEDLSRVAGVDRPVWEMTGEELGALDVGSHFDRKFAGERVVTLDDAILTVKGHLDLNIEIKVHGHESKSFVADVVAAIRRHGFVADCVVTSLDQAALQEVKRLDPALRRGMIITAKLGAASDIDVDFYSVQPLIATVGFIQKAHDEGRDVHVWTLNTAETMRTFIARGADNLITDRPRLAREILDARTDTDRLSDALARLFRRP